MILRENHTKEAINKIRNDSFKGKDPQLVEKILKALTFLELLAQEKISFTFKGGTCLLLLLEPPRRFSIDLDLIVTNRNELLEVLEQICKSNPMFTHFEEDIRAESKIPKAHYKVFYTSDVSGKEAYVLVDIIEENASYPTLTNSKISPKYFKVTDPVFTITTPTIDGILGDKLTAFAPRTTGIKLGSGKDMEIAKQLFDVAALFDHATDLAQVHSSFSLVAEKEIKYRGLTISTDDVLVDSFEAAFIIASRGTKEKEIYTELLSGINKLKGYVFQNFGEREAHICAAKVAYLSLSLLKSNYNISKFINDDLTKIEIKDPSYNALNKIKKISPEAFWYWSKAIELKLS